MIASTYYSHEYWYDITEQKKTLKDTKRTKKNIKSAKKPFCSHNRVIKGYCTETLLGYINVKFEKTFFLQQRTKR